MFKFNLDFLALVVSSIVAILTYLNLREFKKTNLEETRAQIVFFIEKTHPTLSYNLVLKNFGKSVGKVLDIKISPTIQYSYKSNSRDVSLDYKNTVLAPGQAIVSNFDFKNYTNTHFEVYIQYESCNKIFQESYAVNLSLLKDLGFKVPVIKTCEEGLDQLNRTLLGVSNKLSS